MQNDFFSGGDRKTLILPATQMALAETVCDACANVVVIVLAGSAVTLNDKVIAHARAILHGWYPGAAGGLAAAELITGIYSPSGRLPVTFYRSVDDLPDFRDYSMAGRTYRYFAGEPLYPFGYGLAYTTFGYSDVKLAGETDDSYTITLTLINTGSRPGSEKVQVYASFTDSRTTTPIRQLCGVTAVYLAAGESTAVTLNIDKSWLRAVLADGSRVTPDGSLCFWIGGHQPDAVSCTLCGSEPVKLIVKSQQ